MTNRSTTGDAWEDYFVSGERLLWEGGPTAARPGLLALILAVFGLPFFVAGLFISGSALFVPDAYPSGFGWGILMRVFVFCFGVPFAAVGAGMVFGPSYLALRAPHHVRYALSDRRAYIATNWWSRKMETLVIAKDAPVRVENGHSVFFHHKLTTDSDGDKSVATKGFERIADASEVYRLIRKIQEDS